MYDLPLNTFEAEAQNALLSGIDPTTNIIPPCDTAVITDLRELTYFPWAYIGYTTCPIKRGSTFVIITLEERVRFL